MIYGLEGIVIEKDEDFLLVNVNGIIYQIFTNKRTINNINDLNTKVKLYTQMIIRENDISLYGFTEFEDISLFKLLITVSGIGPKQAIKILSELSPNELRNAIVSEDERIIKKVKGIGEKLALKIILELKNKIKKIIIEDKQESIDSSSNKKLDILMALRVLGYNDFEAKKNIEALFKTNPEINDLSVEEILKLLLPRMKK